MNDMMRKVGGGVAVGAALAAGLSPVAVAGAQARARAHAARATYPKRGAAFVGVSSEKSGTLPLPVDIRASATGLVMSRFDIQWGALCTSATGRGSYGGLSITLNKKISSAGVFTDSGSFTRAFSNGDKALFSVALFGRFTSPLRAAGTFRVKVTVTDSTGATTDNCDSGVISWAATN